jgi:hypothetical protein
VNGAAVAPAGLEHCSVPLTLSQVDPYLGDKLFLPEQSPPNFGVLDLLAGEVLHPADQSKKDSRTRWYC